MGARPQFCCKLVIFRHPHTTMRCNNCKNHLFTLQYAFCLLPLHRYNTVHTLMLKGSITIRNFGPIRDAHIDEIHPFTILIGESASGKSTILKVVALFRYIYKMLNIRFYLKNANIDKSPFRIRLKDYFKANPLDEYVKPNSEIAYTVTVNGNKYELIYANGKLKNPKAMQDEDLVFFKGSFISENRNIIPTWAAKASNNRGASLGFYFHETYHDFDDATNLIDEIKLNYLNLKFQVRKVNGKKKFTVSDSGKTYSPVDLRAASSGVQTSVPLLAITRYYAHDFDFKQALRRSVLSYLYDTDRLLKFQPQVELNKLARYVHLHVEVTCGAKA